MRFRNMEVASCHPLALQLRGGSSFNGLPANLTNKNIASIIALQTAEAENFAPAVTTSIKSPS
jgi:hypothetical protein